MELQHVSHQSLVEREENREALGQECIAAHEHFKTTGLHLTQEEVEAWLLDLEAGNDVEPPACHQVAKQRKP